MSRTLRPVLIAMLATGVLVPLAAAQEGDPEGPRLEGRYDVDYKRKTYSPQEWFIAPRCTAGACDAKLTGTDVNGTLKYLGGPGDYRISNSYKGGVCTRKDAATGKREVVLRPSLKYSETITIDRFTGPAGAPVTAAQGVIVARARPLEKAKRLGCTNSLRLRTKFTLKLR